MSDSLADKIMIVRHAEKPDDLTKGVTEQGTESKHDVTVRGWQRAGTLACLLTREAVTRPDYLFASAPSDGLPEGASKARSKRSVETLLPISRRLKIKINCSFTKGQERKVAAAAKRCEGVVLIAWQHEAIEAIARALPGSHHGLPFVWPPERFDVIYILKRDPLSPEYGFSQRPQYLLDGDSDDPIR